MFDTISNGFLYVKTIAMNNVVEETGTLCDFSLYRMRIRAKGKLIKDILFYHASFRLYFFVWDYEHHVFSERNRFYQER